MSNISLKIGILGGSSITEAVTESVALAKKLNCVVTFDFNEVYMVVNPTSDIYDKIVLYNKLSEAVYENSKKTDDS